MSQHYCTGAAHLFTSVGPIGKLQAQTQSLYNRTNNVTTGGSGAIGGGNSNGEMGNAFPAGVPVAAQGNSPVYLGTTERGVQFEILDHFRDVQTDDSGDCADDMLWTGHSALITTDVNRWKEKVFVALAARPRFQGFRGLTSDYDMGTLMVREGWFYTLWILFPYVGKLAFGGGAGGAGQAVAAGAAVAGLFAGGVGGAALALPGAAVGTADYGSMPGGYRFPCTTMITEGHEVGTRARKLHLVFKAIRSRRRPGTSTQAADQSSMGARILYDHNIQGLPAVD